MEVNFKQALKWVRTSEGGNDDDPVDHGGRTSRGITQREDDAYHKMAGLPLVDVWHEKDEIIDDIYHKSYWMPYGPILPAGVDYMFFDQCVLAGPHRAALTLQAGLGFSGAQLDGHIGMVTSAAVTHADPATLVDAMARERLRSYNSIVEHNPSQRKYIRGWSSRVAFAKGNAHTLLVKVA